MQNVNDVRFTVIEHRGLPQDRVPIMHPLSYWEKRRAIKKLDMERPLLGLVANYLIKYLPTTVSIDVTSTLRMSSPVGPLTIVLRPKKRFQPAGLERSLKLASGRQGTLWLLATLQLRLSQGYGKVLPVYVLVDQEYPRSSLMQKLSQLFTRRSVLGQAMRSHSSSTTSGRSIVPLRNGHLPNGPRSKIHRMP